MRAPLRLCPANPPPLPIVACELLRGLLRATRTSPHGTMLEFSLAALFAQTRGLAWRLKPLLRMYIFSPFVCLSFSIIISELADPANATHGVFALYNNHSGFSNTLVISELPLLHAARRHACMLALVEPVSSTYSVSHNICQCSAGTRGEKTAAA